MKMTKKSMVMSVMILVVSLFLVGCLDYKAYDLQKDQAAGKQEDQAKDNAQLLDEIAAIEATLNATPTPVSEEKIEEEAVSENVSENKTEEREEGEVVLPEITKEKAEVTEEKKEELSGDLQTITVDENEAVKLKVIVRDPDGDNVSYRFSSPLNEKGEWKTNYGDAGEYVITITASDGKLTSKENVKIVVNRVNVPPVIEGVKNLRVKEGEEVAFKPEVSDPNKDKVTMTVSEPLTSGRWKTDHTSAGEYEIKIVASDGELDTERSFFLEVTDVNVLPEVTGLLDIAVKEGEIVKIQPVITDLDEDEIILTIGDPVGNDGVWETSYTDHGTYTVKITANDGKDTVTKNVKVAVEDVNVPPEIVDIFVETR